MSGEKTAAYIGAEHVARTRHDLGLGGADVGDQRVRRNQRADALEQVDNAADGRGENDEITAANSLCGIGDSVVDGAEIVRLLEHMLAIAADDAANKSALANGQRKRSADEARADNRDLPEAHSTESSATI